jgi:uncharacterized protein YggE
MAAVFLVSALFVACGGDDDDDTGDDGGSAQNINSSGDVSGIRTEKGLAVAAAGQQLGANFGGNAESAADSALPATGNIGPASGAGGGAGGVAADAASRVGIGSNGYSIGPALQEGGNGLTVQGYGSATATADQAVIELWFYRDAYGNGVPVPEGDFDSVDPITEAELQPVIAALEAFGAEVEFINQNYGYYDPFYSNVGVRATMSDLDSVDEAIDAANAAADGIGNVNRSGASTYYTLSDCSAMERAAMAAAVEDAEERADVLADVLGVTRGSVIGASNYSYSPYGNGSCSSGGYYAPYPMFGAEGESAPGPTDVVVFANVGVTYAIQ